MHGFEISTEAVVLAGGASSRFGSDKMQARIGERTFLEQTLLPLKTLRLKISLSGAKEKLERFSLPIIEDEQTGRGPLAALSSILKHAQAQQALIVAVDMPFINLACLQTLLNHADGKHVCHFHTEQQTHPFPGIYPKACLKNILELIKNERYNLMALLENFPTKSLSVKKYELDHNAFKNINTKEEHIQTVEQK